MVLSAVVWLAGLILLYYGAKCTVVWSSKLARNRGIRPVIIGLTIVAYGTSLPEGFVSFFSAVTKNFNICIANVLGSNLINIGLVLGCAALISPLAVEKQIVRGEFMMMAGSTLLLWLFGIDNVISRFEGTLMVALFIWINYRIIKTADNLEHQQQFDEVLEIISPKRPLNTALSVMLVFAGLVMLAAGSSFLVDRSVFFARILNIPDWVIGMTIVALGTSLPELATSVFAAVRKEHDISIGNVIGSNIFNILLVLGLSALINPLKTDAGSYFKIDSVVLVLFTLGLYPLMRQGYILSRAKGFLLLMCYAVYTVFLVLRGCQIL